MSKIKVIIIAAVAAVIGYCGVTYYMGEKTTTTKVKEVIKTPPPAIKKDELDKLEEKLKKEEKAKIRG